MIWREQWLSERILTTKLRDSCRRAQQPIGSLGAGVNPAPTLRVNESPAGAGFSPARVGYHSLQIAQLRLDCFADYWLDSLSRLLI
jgi:hypothetical protein